MGQKEGEKTSRIPPIFLIRAKQWYQSLKESGRSRFTKKVQGEPGWHSQLHVRLVISSRVSISGSWVQASSWAPLKKEEEEEEEQVEKEEKKEV